MNNQELQNKRREMIESINEADNLILIVSGERFTAKAYGTKLDYPMIEARTGGGGSINCAVSWSMMERIANKEVTEVTY